MLQITLTAISDTAGEKLTGFAGIRGALVGGIIRRKRYTGAKNYRLFSKGVAI
jgi:hypothetical protein